MQHDLETSCIAYNFLNRWIFEEGLLVGGLVDHLIYQHSIFSQGVKLKASIYEIKPWNIIDPKIEINRKSEESLF